jgi:hypothetical protein
VLEFVFATLEPIGDLAQGARLSQLTEQHRDELLPAGEALGSMLRFEGMDVLGEACALKQLEDLAEQTSSSNHCDLRR